MPLYEPPKPPAALRRAVGSTDGQPEPRVRRESVLPDNLTLQRRGISVESEIMIPLHESTRDTTATGEYAFSNVSEVQTDGSVRRRRVIVQDVGDSVHYVVGTPGAIRAATAQTAVNPGPTSESARPQGGMSETALVATPYEYGPAQSDSDLVLQQALAQYAEQVAAVQYDAALGIGQPVYEAPSGSAPEQPYYNPSGEPLPADYYGVGVPEPEPYLGGSLGI